MVYIVRHTIMHQRFTQAIIMPTISICTIQIVLERPSPALQRNQKIEQGLFYNGGDYIIEKNYSPKGGSIST